VLARQGLGCDAAAATASTARTAFDAATSRHG
jgi:hypothetical protein